FTDCGIFPITGLFTGPDYPACTEGATKFVAASVIQPGSIFQYGGAPEPQFSNHTDNIITGSIELSFRGDQVVVFQDAANPGGSAQPSANPKFIFIVSSGAGNFTSHSLPFVLPEDPNFPNDGSGTSIPLTLTEDNLPAGSATALAVGTGGGDFDFVIFNGTGLVPFMGATLADKVLNAKIAIVETASTANESDGVNWYGVTALDPTYTGYENLLLSQGGNILPVELTSFNGRPKVTTIDLQWVTASETNNDYFAVEKSTDGIDFKEMTEIDGRGTTNLESYYTWADESPNDGLNYYRLLQVDFNGDKSYSDMIAIAFKADRDEIQVYPNPTVRELNLNFPENWDGETSIVIYDFYGNMINSFTNSSGSLTFSVDNLPAGFYRLSAINKSKILNTSFVKK
ncbi:MAG: T9SS type A sorting domain-containing protein, partial [Saprospiraceae bacterium]